RAGRGRETGTWWRATPWPCRRRGPAPPRRPTGARCRRALPAARCASGEAIRSPRPSARRAPRRWRAAAPSRHRRPRRTGSSPATHRKAAGASAPRGVPAGKPSCRAGSALPSAHWERRRAPSVKAPRREKSNHRVENWGPHGRYPVPRRVRVPAFTGMTAMIGVLAPRTSFPRRPEPMRRGYTLPALRRAARGRKIDGGRNEEGPSMAQDIPIRDIESLPPPVEGPSVWYGPEMAKRTDWVHTLSVADVAEIEAAMRPLADGEADIARITKAQFPLPTLAP